MSTSNGDEEQRCGGRTKARLGLAIYVLATVLSPGLSSPAAAQPLDTPYLVRDIANTAPVAQADTHLMFETAVNGRALFWAASDSAGSYWTLWSTDGTAVGTVPISDLLAYEATTSLNSATLCADVQRWMLWAPGSPGGTRSVWASDGTLSLIHI